MALPSVLMLKTVWFMLTQRKPYFCRIVTSSEVTCMNDKHSVALRLFSLQVLLAFSPTYIKATSAFQDFLTVMNTIVSEVTVNQRDVREIAIV